jgi:hypothetical protein
MLPSIAPLKLSVIHAFSQESSIDQISGSLVAYPHGRGRS